MNLSQVVVLYDEQCEICQAGVSWIKTLDTSNNVATTPIDPKTLQSHHPGVGIDECLQSLHIIDEDQQVMVGWDAVVTIASVMPISRPLAWLDKNKFTRMIAGEVYNWVARNRYELSKCSDGVCTIDLHSKTKSKSAFRVFWTCYNLGLVFRLPLIVWQFLIGVTAIHHHEEHVGNIEWVSQYLKIPIFLTEAVARKLRNPSIIPKIRRIFIGQPQKVSAKITTTGTEVPVVGGSLEVFPTPGHCDDHIVFWDAEEKLLLVGDSFIGVYFSSPNPDVDCQKWISTLEMLIDLQPEIMVEAHGHIHTVRSDVLDALGVVLRNDPVELLKEKLRMLQWVRQQIDYGVVEGLSSKVIEASFFPWGSRWRWENIVADETARFMTNGEFSRTELIHSFHREDDSVLPRKFKAKVISEKSEI